MKTTMYGNGNENAAVPQGSVASGGSSKRRKWDAREEIKSETAFALVVLDIGESRFVSIEECKTAR